MRPAALLCFLALALSACGATPRDSAQDFEGAERDVATTVEAIEAAARDNDSGELCTKLLSERLLVDLKRRGTRCATAVEQSFDAADGPDLTVDDVVVRGSTATAKVTARAGSHKTTETLELEKVGADWKVRVMRP